MRFLVPLIAALVPLIITPGVLAYFDVTPKISLLLIGVALILLYRKTNLRNVNGLFTNAAGRWWIVSLGAVWLSGAAATAFSTNPALSLDGGNWRRFGLVSLTAIVVFSLAASAWMAADRGNIRIVLRAILAAGMLAALYGIAQYFGWDPLLPSNAYHAGEGPFTIVRPPGTLGHADYFAAWLVAVAFIGIANARLEIVRWRQYASWGASAVIVFAIILTGARSALLAILIGAVVFWIAETPRPGRRTVRAAVLCLIAFAAFFFSPAGAMLRARLHWSLDDLKGGARLLLWRDSLAMAADRPVLGYGPETFVTEFPRFQSVSLARAYPDFYHESPHNMFLDAFASSGIIGLLSIAGLCGLAAMIAIRLTRLGDLLGPPLAAAFTAVLVCQQFVVFTVPTALSFFVLAGILIAAMISRRGKSLSDSMPTAKGYLPAASIAAALFSVFAVRLLVADGALAVAERGVRSGNAAAAARAYRAVLRWQPAGTGSDLRYSRDMRELATHAPSFAASMIASQEMMKAAIAATRTAEDRQNAWYHLASVLATTNDPVNVEHSLRNAIAWAPNWFKPHWTLAQLLAATGRPDAALIEAAKAADLNAGHDPEVAETLRKLESRPRLP